MVRLAALLAIGLAAALSAGCRGLLPGPAPASRLRVPDEMRRRPAPDAEGGDPRVTRERYVLRMAEGGRLWEVEVPDDGRVWEVRVPVGERAVPASAQAPSPAPSLEADAEARRQAYLLKRAQLQELFTGGRYELALLQVDDLLKTHEADARLWAMKGSILRRLGKGAEAREAWQRSLALQPAQGEVEEALRTLELEEGR